MEFHIIQMARKYIQSNFAKIQGAEDVSEVLGVNYHSLREYFARKVGIPIIQFINYTRCCAAEKMLKTTDWKLFKIALEVGFTNEKNFINMFKKLYGITPDRYRKRSNNNN